MAAVEQDTIVAISTPPGRGGIGIVRLSGPQAREIAAPMLRLRHELEAGRARFGVVLDISTVSDGATPDPTHRAIELRDEWGTPLNLSANPTHRAMELRDEWGTQQDASGDKCGDSSPVRLVLRQAEDSLRAQNDNKKPEGRVLDEVVVTYFAAPHSYTGEDVIEIAMHGAPVLLEHVVRQCCSPRGEGRPAARLAEPGEFTQRAFLAGRIDLTQAEAVGDLIESSTMEQARVAARQMGGALARAVAPPKAELVALIAALEAGIDFAEDDIDVLPADEIARRIADVRAPLAQLEQSFARGRILREGFKLAIVGRPNAGKSSLFNRLVQRERAIVTATPGTTRDLVTETVAINGIPVELIDTAGLREAADEAERIGIAKSREAMADADVVLLVVDLDSDHDDQFELPAEARGRPRVVAFNKRDLLEQARRPIHRIPDSENRASFKDLPADPAMENFASRHIMTSAITGDGIAELRAAIVRAVAGEERGLRESGMLTNLRQHQAIEQALRGLDAAGAALDAKTPHEMLLLDLYEALRGVDALTGATTNEDVLRLIFSTFCIGK